MPRFDSNLIAARVLRQATQRHANWAEAWSLEYRKAWRAAARANSAKGPPKPLLGPRVLHKKLSPERLAQIGDLDGLLPD